MKAYGITDKGRIRSSNQDAWRIAETPEGALCVAVLCDGMGGARGGEVASVLAAESFLAIAKEDLARTEWLDIADIAREAAAVANLNVYDRAFREEALRGMGTTLVGAIIRENDAVVVNIGESRCYWVANGQIQQVTRDHSHVQELVENGAITAEEARSHPRRNLITRAVGIGRRIRSDIFRVDLHAGDRLLLCSDGLSNLVEEAEIGDVLRRESYGMAACRTLLNLALDRGAPDNVTCVLLER